MKSILFISANRILGQGLSAAILSKPEIGFQWTAQLNYSQAVVGADIFHADMMILDVVDQTDMAYAIEICQSLRQDNRDIKILLLVRPEQAAVRSKSVDAQNAGLIDSFVFYDSSLTYLLAKLEAL
ncbi:hypothetical protein H9X85_12330 [Anaerotignum lactatifermentans]|uniref:Response regulatory domain-containing protein n=1 Tax=Anaerotignum lactatifermentans TaxID=160404 RepID=A0ABS2GBU6_9FIRM|nr:hypothetical protein [Anaerotignum lactatifermentans]MBM6830408.1 hypothetical protein [Anaerotignum lactatifermentans]MBM6878926.1 hypothetical protein [Anaerotignum lactatifermentans]MBM6951970.1 hypothetical protein [Anaerotignum lactatifermentans]